MQLTPEQIVSVKGLINNYLFDLEQDIKGQPRANEEVALAIAHVLDPAKYPVSEALAEDLEELKGSFDQPQLLLNFFKRAKEFVYDDATILPEIKLIMLECLLKTLREKAPEHLLLIAAAPVKAAEPAPELVAPVVAPVVVPVQAPVIPAVKPNPYILEDLIRIDVDKVPDAPIESLLIFYPANSLDSLRTFIAINLQYQKFNFPSYKVLNQEHSQVYALRGDSKEVIVVDLTPHMTRDQCLKLLENVRGLDKLYDPNDRYYTKTHRDRVLHSINFHFDGHHCPLVMNPDRTINHDESLKSFRQHIIRKRTCTSCSAPSQAAINLLLMRDLGKWSTADLEEARQLLKDSEDTYYGKKYISVLSLVELENAIGLYFELHENFSAAKRSYENAYDRLDKLMNTKPSGGITIDPYMKGIQVKHSPEQGQRARRLSSLIVISINLIDMTIRTAGSMSLLDSHITKLQQALHEFKTVKRYELLKLSEINGVTKFSKSCGMGIFDQDMLAYANHKMRQFGLLLSAEATKKVGFTINQMASTLKINPEALCFFSINFLGYLIVHTTSPEQASNLEPLFRTALDHPIVMSGNGWFKSQTSGGWIKVEGSTIEISSALFAKMQQVILGKALIEEDDVLTKKRILSSNPASARGSLFAGLIPESKASLLEPVKVSVPKTTYATKNVTPFDLDKWMTFMDIAPDTVLHCMPSDSCIGSMFVGVDIVFADRTNAQDAEQLLREKLGDVSKSKYGYLIDVHERKGQVCLKINWDAYKDLNLLLNKADLNETAALDALTMK